MTSRMKLRRDERKNEKKREENESMAHLYRDIPVISTVNVTYFQSDIKEEMRGLTVVDDKLYVIHNKSDPSQPSRVYVYDSHTLTAQPPIYIPGMKKPHDLAGSSHDKVLYVSERNNHCVFRINLSDNSVKYWTLRKVQRGSSMTLGLCVTLEHNVLVTVLQWGENRENALLEYTSEGLLIREICVERNIEWAWQTIQVSSDQFIICHGVYGSLHRLCIINSDGRIIKRYGEEREQGEGDQVEPHSVAISNNMGDVFVSDQSNNRILVLSKDLIVIGQVQTRDRLGRPLCLYFDSFSDRLFVGYVVRTEVVNDLTVIDDKIFVINDKSSYIKVYDSISLASLPRININDMKNPQGLTSCPQNNTLYVSDFELKCIHRVNLVDNFVKFWKLSENYHPIGLSLTSKHNLLVTVCISMPSSGNKSSEQFTEHSTGENRNDHQFHHHLYSAVVPSNKEAMNETELTEEESRVLEYTSEGRLIREIKLDRSIEEAWQTIQLSTDTFIICHGQNSSHHRICIINSEGQIIKSYGGETGQADGQLCEPRSIAIDKNKDVIYVADQGNNRVLIFSTELTLIGHLQTRDNMEYPSCLFLDSDRLFVGELFGERLYIICMHDL